jgi:hypothetical protein
MHGIGLDSDVRDWFRDAAASRPRRVPRAQVPRDLIQRALARAR